MSYRDDYENRKQMYLNPAYVKSVGMNAAWVFPFYKSYDWWYIPGGARSPAHSYDYEVNVKINYRETDSQKFANDLINAVKEDLSYWKYKVADTIVDDEYSEIAVYVYETNSFFSVSLGYRYRYFFIRQEPFLKFYSMLYDGKIYEGFKDELLAVLKLDRNLLTTASFYWKE